MIGSIACRGSRLGALVSMGVVLAVGMLAVGCGSSGAEGGWELSQPGDGSDGEMPDGTGAPDMVVEPSGPLALRAGPGDKSREFVKISNRGDGRLEIDDAGLGGDSAFGVSVASPSEIDCSAEGAEVFGDAYKDGSVDFEAVARTSSVSVGEEDRVSIDELLPGMYAPGECSVLIVAFSPNDKKTKLGAVSVSGAQAEGDATVSLYGNARAPCLEVSERPVDFGIVPIMQSKTLPVRFRHCRESETSLGAVEPVKVSGVSVANSTRVFSFGARFFFPTELMAGNDQSSVELSGDEEISMQVQARPDRTGQFGQVECEAATEPVVRVQHNGIGANDGVTNVCLVVAVGE